MTKILNIGQDMVGIPRKEYERLLIQEENYIYSHHDNHKKRAEICKLKKEIAFLKMRETLVQRESRKQLEPSNYDRQRISQRVVVSDIGGIRYGEY